MSGEGEATKSLAARASSLPNLLGCSGGRGFEVQTLQSAICLKLFLSTLQCFSSSAADCYFLGCHVGKSSQIDGSPTSRLVYNNNT